MAMVGDLPKINLGTAKLDSKSSSRDLLGLNTDRADVADQFKSRLDKKVDAKSDIADNKPTPKKPINKKDDERKLNPRIADQKSDVQKDKYHEDEDQINPYSTDLPKKFNSAGPVKAQVVEQQPGTEASAKEVRFSEIREQNVQSQVNDEQKPILQFMVFMKEQYGIEPEELVKALNSLSQKELLATPQESMLSFFKNLGIENEDVEPAKEQYVNMLAQLNQIESQKTAPVIQPQPVDVQVIDPKKQRIQEVNRKLDQMNASFFMNSPVKKEMIHEVAVKPEYGLSDNSMLTKTEAAPKFESDNFFVDSKKSVDLKNYSQQIKTAENSVSPAVQQPSQSSSAAPVVNEFFPAEQSLVASAEEQSLPVSESGVDKNNLSKILDNHTSEKIERMEVQLNNLEKSSTNSDPQAEHHTSEDLYSGNANQVTFAPDKQVEGSQGTFAADLKAADRNPKTENQNIQQIIQQANVMIRRGGGEMKMQLNPEGLGNVKLKVKVDEGKVGIQMIADTADAKRLLEGSISDLKANLSQHKMTVDTFKVDVSDKFNESLNQQSDLNREDARNFLGQFREQNEFARNFFNDSPGYKAYRQYGGTQTVKQPVEQPMARSNDKGRIHLVA